MGNCRCPIITNEQIIAMLFIIAPQLRTEDPEILAGYNALIDAIRCQVNICALGCNALMALANLLAHYITISNNPYTGVSNSIKEGQLSISMANTVKGNFFGSTAYGQAYNSLIGSYKLGAYVTNTRRCNYGPPCGC